MTSQAKSLSPSQRWLGNDGNWSTFAINVGTPPKTLFVLPSTSGRSTWVVLPQGCGAEADPSSCNTTRGEVFDPGLSSTFKRVGDPNKFYQLNFGPEADLSPLLPPALNYTGASLPWTDVLGFGTDSNDAPTLDNQLIVGYAPKVPYVGQLGLSWANETVVSLQEPELSVLGALRSIDAISSQYWGYTAGAIYRSSFGSLTLGGYDANAGNVDNVLTVPMATDTNRSLTLEIVSTSLSDVPQPLSMAAISAFIDSVVPEIWLPEALCREFENELGLVWNDTVGMYLVDDDLHNRLTTRNASVIFSLAASAGDTRSTVNITLPYAAWDLSVGYPLLGALYGNDSTKSTRYFPLKRGNSNDQYYLGRTFLQEAYVAADYDNQEFHVSPATFRSGDQNIRTVTFPHKSGISGGAIAGIVIGVVAALAIAGGLLWWCCWQKRKGNKKERRSTLGTSSVGDNTTIAEWQDGVQMQQVEQYKPAEVSGEELDRFKPELDATVTARGAPTEIHELWGGSVRRASDQSRASISPLEERHRMSRYSHNRTVSSKSFGQPSPPMSDQPSPPIGYPSPPLGTSGRDSPFGQPSPQAGARIPAAVDQDRSWFGGAPLYELHGRSRDSPRSPTGRVQAPEEVPLTSEHMLGPSERETRRSGFVEEFDQPAQSEDRP